MDLYKRQFPLEKMAKIFGFHRGSYYKNSRGKLSKRKIAQKIAEPLIIQSFNDSEGEYGSRRIIRFLKKNGVQMGKTRVVKIMNDLGLKPKARKKFKVTTQQSSKPYYVAPNLLAQEFTSAAPNQAWVSDITYVPTQEGWLYVATVIDLFSRKVVGLAMSHRLKTDLVLRAVGQAVSRRNPMPGLILHSDRGSQYTSRAYRKLTYKSGITLSMSGTGNCYDNAVAESFFHTLKIAVVHGQTYQTRNQATRAIFEYIELFYNQKRMHSTPNYCSPNEFEETYFNQPVYPLANCSLNR
jgi:transposase InsO family protein